MNAITLHSKYWKWRWLISHFSSLTQHSLSHKRSLIVSDTKEDFIATIVEVPSAYRCPQSIYLICENNFSTSLAPLTNVEAIEGQQTQLYCPMTAPSSDKINMVLWFKDDVGVPIYR